MDIKILEVASEGLMEITKPFAILLLIGSQSLPVLYSVLEYVKCFVWIIIPCDISKDSDWPFLRNAEAFIFPPISSEYSGFSLLIPTLPSFIIVNTSVLILDTDKILSLEFCLIDKALSNELFSIMIFCVFKLLSIILLPYTYKLEFIVISPFIRKLLL